MKYWRGYVVAAIFAAITVVLMQMGARFSTLIDMVYPYVIRTLQTVLAEWSSGVSFCLWQFVLIVLAVLGLASIVLMVILKWNPIQWFGWVLSVFTCIYMLHTLLFGLNYYAGPLADDIRLDVVSYSVDELTEAAEYYRDEANALALMVDRNADGSVDYPDFATLAASAGEGFQNLTYDYSYPIFAGSTLPVKELGWADMYTSMGITGITIGLTGEAAVNPQIPAVSLPFTMCHEMAHRMCIATERDANFSAFLACMAHSDIEFQYSGYFMAYRYCYNALLSAGTTEASAAAARVQKGVNEKLYSDMASYNKFFQDNRSDSATKVATVANDTYLKTSGDSAGVASYGEVCDLLVSWHIQQIVLPSIADDEKAFDPFDKNWVYPEESTEAA